MQRCSHGLFVVEWAACARCGRDPFEAPSEAVIASPIASAGIASMIVSQGVVYEHHSGRASQRVTTAEIRCI
jgi:hypothetical protein